MKYFLSPEELQEHRNPFPVNSHEQGTKQTNDKDGFIVRVELHGIKDSEDYHKLRTYMTDNDFTKVIINKSGIRYKLPTATYYFPNPTNTTPNDTVHQAALGAIRAALDNELASVKALNKHPTILVTETQNLLWTGLEEATSADL